MIRVSVLYPNSADAHFDLDYYVQKHMALVWEILGPKGMIRAEVDRGVMGMGDESAPYVTIGHLYFESVEQFEQAFAEGTEPLFDDVPHYTNIGPVVQISEIIDVEK